MIVHSDGSRTFSGIELILTNLCQEGWLGNEPIEQTAAWKRARGLIAAARTEDPAHSDPQQEAER